MPRPHKINKKAVGREELLKELAAIHQTKYDPSLNEENNESEEVNKNGKGKKGKKDIILDERKTRNEMYHPKDGGPSFFGPRSRGGPKKGLPEMVVAGKLPPSLTIGQLKEKIPEVKKKFLAQTVVVIVYFPLSPLVLDGLIKARDGLEREVHVREDCGSFSFEPRSSYVSMQNTSVVPKFTAQKSDFQMQLEEFTLKQIWAATLRDPNTLKRQLKKGSMEEGENASYIQKTLSTTKRAGEYFYKMINFLDRIFYQAAVGTEYAKALPIAMSVSILDCLQTGTQDTFPFTRFSE